ncbi:class I SAM-dependent methyltransferase [Paenibacillus sp. GCM10012307]|uniref:SAM-dependent methyltransferase n=1 Tax=Paenibacillus roseus TaxID=2798579 RepID=A0A934MQF4_9BACL|nr:SAM-dependent methyltransferase [Paenibacillus roseus]MBJ6361329.1 SAM-dependent methyltransferase [Paenibacillus roseus]
MDNWQQQVHQWFEIQSLHQATLSQLRRKDAGFPLRTIIRPVSLKAGLHYQFEYHEQNRVTHDNLLPDQAAARTVELLTQCYRQGLFKTSEADVQILISKKGKASLLGKPATTGAAKQPLLTHNRKKRYVLEEGVPVQFLIELGIMTKEGKIHAKKQDKFRQINRFLEIASDMLPHLPKDRELTIVDFGCGKSYLTFALYHLLVHVHNLDIRIVGLDLKTDVIAFCRGLAERLGYDRLEFIQGDIAEYEGVVAADMVVTLHACDTATDAALIKAVRWGASVILSVPCCQHELFAQIQSDTLAPLLTHGLFRERFAALATDALRAQLLETLGYKTQVLEFIDPEHTPKNIMIRAFKAPKTDTAQKWSEYVIFRDSIQAVPHMEKHLSDLLPEA